MLELFENVSFILYSRMTFNAFYDDSLLYPTISNAD
jgi:hypothetical protein